LKYYDILSFLDGYPPCCGLESLPYWILTSKGGDMGALTILEKGAPCDEVVDWPAFYMNDFSVLGLVVDNVARALEVLESDGYQVDRKVCSAKVRFDSRRRLRNIYNTLARHRVEFTMSDLVSCAYQG
jgi:hypothetical protein